MTQLSKNFTLEEMVLSTTANAKGINNQPIDKIKEHLQALVANVLQPLRDLYGKAITVSSGYRCPKLNTAIGGASNSQHMQGYAADIKPADGNMAAFKAVVLEWAKTNAYDQIIMEKIDSKGNPRWIHIGFKHADKGQRKQKLRADMINGKWHYTTYKG